MITSNFRKELADSWFDYLQRQICKEFEFLEDNRFKFSKRDWKKEKEREGESRYEIKKRWRKIYF